MTSQTSNEFVEDPEGFQKLLDRNFVLYKGLIFLAIQFKESLIDERLKRSSAEDVQRLHNHQHMFFYASFDIEKQREYGKRLREVWRKN